MFVTAYLMMGGMFVVKHVLDISAIPSPVERAGVRAPERTF